MLENQKIVATSPSNTTNIEQQLDPLQDGISSIELVRVSGSDVDVVNAARVSYGKFVATLTDRDQKLIQFLMDHNHTSPFEHNQLSFRVKCPVYVSKQWMRHRMNSYNEISYRYVKAPLEFYIPKTWRYQDKNNKQSSLGAFANEDARNAYKQSLELSYKTYESLMEAGICREQARGILPTCTYTQFIFTCNLHSLMSFLTLRLHAGAQYEIRVFALAMLKLALPHFPFTLQAWKNKNASINTEYDLIKFGDE